MSFIPANHKTPRDLKALKAGCKALGIKLEETAISDLITFHALLDRANSQMNLTKIISWADVVTRHYLDSLSIVLSVPSVMDGKEDIIDVGSGFGVPGIPLTLIFPGNKMVMLDSVGKKINFIKSIVDTMDLANAETAVGRAEEWGKKKEHRQRYSVVLSRAVAALPVLLELTLPFCRLGGVVVAMKGRRALSEVNDSEKALELLGGEIEEVVDVKRKLPFSSGQLVLVRKVSETPEMFPRKAGIPQKRPLY